MSMEDNYSAEETREEMHEAGENSTVEQSSPGGKIRISEDVISQIAAKALVSIHGVEAAAPGIMANLMGRKAVNGVRITLTDGDAPDIQVDSYITVKFGLRIPDLCWDVQEAIKDQVERATGYNVRSVNVYVQGIAFEEQQTSAEDRGQMQ